MMDALVRKFYIYWESFVLSLFIKNVNCILFWVGVNYFNYYYLLFFSIISVVSGDFSGNVLVRGGIVIFIFFK